MSVPPSDLTPTDHPIVALIMRLPEPCAIATTDGRLLDANPAWHDVFFNAGLGLGLVEACGTLFRWEGAAFGALEQDLRLLLAGQIDRVQFEAQIAEPPERWAVCALVISPDARLIIWQLTDVTRWQIAESETVRVYKQFRDAVDSISDGFAIYDADDRLVFCNNRYREIYARSGAAIVPGRTFEEIVRAGAFGGQYPEATGREEEFVAQRVAVHKALGINESLLSSGRWIRSIDRPTSEGGIVSIRTDITDVKQAEDLRRQSHLQDEMLRVQEALLAELSTPILQIAEGAIVLPLIGAVDSHRAQRVVESLLAAVDTHGASLVILDITGVPLVDTQVANVLIHCARAVRLLGARLVLTGIRPDVAQTIVSLGIDLGGIITRGDLRDGISFALAGR